jgi:hypothetical protein
MLPHDYALRVANSPMSSAKRGFVWEFLLCARYLLSDGCGEWINLDAIHKMAIIRMDGKFGKPGSGF